MGMIDFFFFLQFCVHGEFSSKILSTICFSRELFICRFDEVTWMFMPKNYLLATHLKMKEHAL